MRFDARVVTSGVLLGGFFWVLIGKGEARVELAVLEERCWVGDCG